MSEKSKRRDITQPEYDSEFEGDRRLDSNEKDDYDWESVDWNESVDEVETSSEYGRDWSPVGVKRPQTDTTSTAPITRHPDRLKVLATTSLVILAFISMLSLFFWATMYLTLFLADTPWVEGWMLLTSSIVSVILTGILWMFVRNSIDRA